MQALSKQLTAYNSPTALEIQPVVYTICSLPCHWCVFPRKCGSLWFRTFFSVLRRVHTEYNDKLWELYPTQYIPTACYGVANTTMTSWANTCNLFFILIAELGIELILSLNLFILVHCTICTWYVTWGRKSCSAMFYYLVNFEVPRRPHSQGFEYFIESTTYMYA